MILLMLLFVIGSWASDVQYTRIGAQIRVLDSKGQEHQLGPGYFYTDEEHQKLALRSLECQKQAQEQRARADHAQAVLDVYRERDAALSLVDQERKKLETRLSEIQDREVQLWRDRVQIESRATALAERESRRLRRRNLWHKLGTVVAFAAGMKLGGI